MKVHINDSSSVEYLLNFERGEIVLGIGCPGTRIQKCAEHLRKHSDCLCKFSEDFQHFQIIIISEVIPQILMKIWVTPLRQKKVVRCMTDWKQKTSMRCCPSKLCNCACIALCNLYFQPISLNCWGKEIKSSQRCSSLMILFLSFRADILKNEMKVFFVKYNDPIYVKLEKLDIMIRLANQQNIAQVLAELKE